ncbi:MAG: methylenetetrahydrofolate--tRNA-(uracil(54)-C(5))-methyltransferase (FADH(2)-oxidizing) TrmFO [Ruminococcus sp.]|jgi:methylenetetrahydrofolate--tRNA-(uracil-5-)-methyltransferase|nr:methylenetetrahydrofolate--tRNA-(uracil(54)-C(5))-methyltransferase (FADH(2)-oxidizing) TrmFO [Ruminococcus sp.]
MDKISVIGGGFSGVEAAFALASHGFSVTLFEQKPAKYTPAHSYPGLCELVCSNSFKASRINSAAGLLKAEMKLLGSLTVPVAESCAVPAGGALAVDRKAFSDAITLKIAAHPLITVENYEITEIPDGNVIIATGPLTDGGLAESIQKVLSAAKCTASGAETAGNSGEFLHFFDAAAPIITAESIDMNTAFFGARYGRGEDDYINCPFNEKADYERFINALITAESAPKHEIDRVYEGCMPIEVLAKRGFDAPRFGPLKPVGFTDPVTGRRPYALVQLRKETSEGRLYNIVGFQTNLKFGEQERVFRLIPGLQNAEFARYGVMHRNSFIDSPRLLNADFSLRKDGRIIFAGQISGVEGYMESAASGLIAGISLARKLADKPPLLLPKTTMTGALTAYISDESVKKFEPMGANMGILPPLCEPIKGKQERYQALADRAIADLERIL